MEDSEFESRQQQEFLSSRNAQTGSTAHPASYSKLKRAGIDDDHSPLVLRLRMSEASLLLSLYAFIA
jgi:hypothetical protein